MRRDQRKVQTWLDQGAPEDVREAFARLFRKPRSPASSYRPRTSTKDARRQRHREETAALRVAVMARAGGKCEMCNGEERPDHALSRLEMHHLISGSGQRRQRQAVENCIALCRFCHKMLHGTIHAACAVEAWCKKYGYPVPDRVAKAVAKLEAEIAAHPGADQPKQQED